MQRAQMTGGLRELFEKRFHEWFIRYNPFYFFSALCVLLGVLLVSRGLGGMDWRGGQLCLSAVIQCYEILLIGGAALLFRFGRRQYRPAVILAVIEIFFMFDGTFRLELFATLGSVGILTSALWAALVAAKLYALARCFSLRIPYAALIVIILAAGGLAGLPHALELFRPEKGLIHLGAIWYGVLLAVILLYRSPKLTCHMPLTHWQETVLRRVRKTAFWVWGGFYFSHLAAAMSVLQIPVTPAQAAPFFLILCLGKREKRVWAGGILTLLFTSWVPLTLSPAAAVVGGVYLVMARRGGRARLYPGAVLCFYLAVWTFGWEGGAFPGAEPWLILTATGLLLLMAWFRRTPAALVAAIVAILPGSEHWLPSGALQWGAFCLLIGFVTLPAGIALNWTHGPPLPRVGREKGGGGGAAHLLLPPPSAPDSG
jgi:hypothetical protein